MAVGSWPSTLLLVMAVVFAYYVLTLVLLETVSPKMYGNDYFVDLKFVFVLGSYSDVTLTPHDGRWR